MRFATLFALAAPLTAVLAADVTTEYVLTHDCKRKTQKYDNIRVHYKGTLQKDGSKFDSSYDRGDPLAFWVGRGQVIPGWDNGLLDMCPGDKRILTIPPEHGYGDRNVGPIPASSTLIFETELVEIVGVDPEPKVVKEADKASEPEPKEADAAPEASETTKEAEAKETVKEEL